MRKFLTTPLPLILLLSFTSDLNAQDFDFRKTNFGFSKEEVLATESAEREKVVEDTLNKQQGYDVLVYSAKIGKLDSYIVYYFTSDKLYKTRYVFKETYKAHRNYIADFKSIDKILKNKYGKPQVDKEKWYGDLWKGEPGVALVMGDLSFWTRWSENEGRTKIYHELSGENYAAAHFIEYSDNNLIKLKEKEDSNQNLSDF